MKRTRYIFLASLAVFILLARNNAAMGEWYATTIYPIVSAALSWSVSWVPFSMEEVLVVAAVLLAVWVLWRGIRNRKRWWKVMLPVAEIAAWLVVWFYLGWGMNYFRESIYERASVGKQQFNQKEFENFLQGYVENLNGSFSEDALPDNFKEDIKGRFAQIPSRMGLCTPKGWQQEKRLLFGGVYSSVGVLGFMGPFFAEMQINGDLLPQQIPFCYAHELSHLLGVSSEDEANFWAYTICTASSIPVVRYSGYFSLLPYVLTNARIALPPDSYKALLLSINPSIREQFNAQQQYWREKYSPLLGIVQGYLYDLMLKGNKIPSGTKNYLQVIDLIIAMKEEVISPGN